MNTTEIVPTARDLTSDDREESVSLLSQTIAEVPFYQWLLGGKENTEAIAWYADTMFSAHIPGGARGVFDEAGHLYGLVLWTTSDRPATPLNEDGRNAAATMIASIPGFPQRYHEMRESERVWTPPERCFAVAFTAVDPHGRRKGLLSGLIDPLVAEADADGSAVLARTSDPELAQTYLRRWNAPTRAEFTLTDGPTIWIVQRDAPV
ncbi:hypothetical protein [Gordonia soli]|uniref:N-acetyltransferase domain-containing protein n=1 Tax=Gordonia soli NBRC 108243 TaxID=1223545 RepID=M0QH61_9ACTN|nr:hypothetical protein [Gordonia soli]GAC67965.1 hypothetical protein GS4_11_02350 [Gordonia soli NBRC 108243]